MASSIRAKITDFTAILPVSREAAAERYQQVYERDRHRIYSLAFWMTDNELAAEELMKNAFWRAFAASPDPSAETVDRALISELREQMPLGVLTLESVSCEQILSLRRNTLRVHLERAVVQLPATERMIFLMHDVEAYDHGRIARMLGLSEKDSQQGLHQARLRLRELLAAMGS